MATVIQCDRCKGIVHAETGDPVDLSAATIDYDHDTDTATWDFSSVFGLIDAYYIATLPAEDVYDSIGNPLPDDLEETFFRLAADATGDARVDAFDLLLVRQNYLLPPGAGRDDNADVFFDGNVDSSDAVFVMMQYLEELTPPGGMAGASDVPEPATAVVLMLGFSVVGLMRRRMGK